MEMAAKGKKHTVNVPPAFISPPKLKTAYKVV